MPLWGANTADAADKPKWLVDDGTYYNKQDVTGVNSSGVSSNNAAHMGWVYKVPGGANSVAFTVVSPGSAYANGETVRLSNVGATNATGSILTDGAGGIALVTTTNPGTANSTNLADGVVAISKKISSITVGAGSANYQNGWPIIFASGSANAVISTNSTGGITGITYNDRGGGYYTAPVANVGQALGNVTIGAGGTGYANGEYLTFTGGAGAGANISVVTDGSGVITGFTYNSRGNNYTSAPTLGVNTAGGSGATLTGALPGTNGSLTVLLAGSGANVVPSLTEGNGRVRTEVLVAL